MSFLETYKQLSDQEAAKIRNQMWSIIVDDFWLHIQKDGGSSSVSYNVEQIKRASKSIKKLSEVIETYSAGNTVVTGLVAEREKFQSIILDLNLEVKADISRYFVNRLYNKLVEP